MESEGGESRFLVGNIVKDKQIESAFLLCLTLLTI